METVISISKIIKNGWKCIPCRHKKILVVSEEDKVLQEITLEEYQDLREQYKNHIEFEKSYKEFLRTGEVK